MNHPNDPAPYVQHDAQPLPGSPEAIALGCTCPVLDNNPPPIINGQPA